MSVVSASYQKGLQTKKLYHDFFIKEVGELIRSERNVLQTNNSKLKKNNEKLSNRIDELMNAFDGYIPLPPRANIYEYTNEFIPDILLQKKDNNSHTYSNSVSIPHSMKEQPKIASGEFEYLEQPAIASDHRIDRYISNINNSVRTPIVEKVKVKECLQPTVLHPEPDSPLYDEIFDDRIKAEKFYAEKNRKTVTDEFDSSLENTISHKSPEYATIPKTKENLLNTGMEESVKKKKSKMLLTNSQQPNQIGLSSVDSQLQKLGNNYQLLNEKLDSLNTNLTSKSNTTASLYDSEMNTNLFEKSIAEIEKLNDTQRKIIDLLSELPNGKASPTKIDDNDPDRQKSASIAKKVHVNKSLSYLDYVPEKHVQSTQCQNDDLNLPHYQDNQDGVTKIHQGKMNSKAFHHNTSNSELLYSDPSLTKDKSKNRQNLSSFKDVTDVWPQTVKSDSYHDTKHSSGEDNLELSNNFGRTRSEICQTSVSNGSSTDHLKNNVSMESTEICETKIVSQLENRRLKEMSLSQHDADSDIHRSDTANIDTARYTPSVNVELSKPKISSKIPKFKRSKSVERVVDTVNVSDDKLFYRNDLESSYETLYDPVVSSRSNKPDENVIHL